MKKFLKRTLSMILSVVLVLGMFAIAPSAASADMMVSVDRASCMQGGSVVATIYFPSVLDKAAAMDIELKYDSTVLELEKYEKGAGLISALDAQVNGDVYSEFTGKPGVISWSLAGSNNYSFRGVFAVVTFKVRTTAKNGPTLLDLTIKDAANSGYVDITSEITTKDATVEVTRNTVNDFEFELNSSKTGYIITAYRCATVADLIIPSKYDDLPVVGIADGVFRNHGELTSVVLPETLETIGANAFQSCVNLKSIEIPNTVTAIGEGAFSLCTYLESVKLPYGITKIESNLFASCYSIKAIEIPFTVTSIGENAFYNCILLAQVKISKNTTIGKDAFRNCYATGIEFTTVEGNTYLPELIESTYTNAKIKLVEDISLGTITGVKAKYDYTGSAIEPVVTITLDNGEAVTLNTDYKVIYVNNVKSGKAKVYVPGIDGYGEGYVADFEVYCAHVNDRKLIVKPATCTKDGTLRHICFDCGRTYEEAIPATGHPSGTWVYDVRPTYLKTGLKHRVCSVCGQSYDKNTIADKVRPDVNLDGRVDAIDALAILQLSVGVDIYVEPEGMFNADANADGKINSIDSLIVLNIAVGAIVI